MNKTISCPFCQSQITVDENDNLCSLYVKDRNIKAEFSEFDLFFSEIEKNFIADERRERKEAKALFRVGKYDIIKFFVDGVNVGFITVWSLPHFSFAEHFVIFERYRNKGYGADALSLFKKMYPKIVLEAEPPITDIAKRRLNFYKRNGFIENPQKYLQPAFREGDADIPLVIMSYPTPLEDFDETVKNIYERIYFKK